MPKKKDKTKKAKQATDKSVTTKAMGFVQADYQKKIPELVLHMFSDGSFWFELADRPSLAKGKSWGISEIRFTNITISVLPM